VLAFFKGFRHTAAEPIEERYRALDYNRRAGKALDQQHNTSRTSFVETASGAGPFLAALRASIRGSQTSAISPARCTIFDDFLPEQALQRLTQIAASREREFRPSGVLHGVSQTPAFLASHRRSRVLSDLGDLRPFLLRQLMLALPTVLTRLSMPAFPVSAVDIQVTATNDGEFFRPHTDSAAGLVERRTVSFTCFFHTEPAPFSGGELRLYSRIGGAPVMAQPHTIIPKRNRIVFFPSDVLHEIATVSCPTRRFCDSRFNVNGWIYR
jgi:SM-20-related protein